MKYNDMVRLEGEMKILYYTTLKTYTHMFSECRVLCTYLSLPLHKIHMLTLSPSLNRIHSLSP